MSKKNQENKTNNVEKKSGSKKAVIFWMGVMFLLIAISIIVGLAINGTLQSLIAGGSLMLSGYILVGAAGGCAVIGLVLLISSIFIKSNKAPKENANELANTNQNALVVQQPMQQQIPAPMPMNQLQQPMQQPGMQQNPNLVQNSRVPLYRVNQPLGTPINQHPMQHHNMQQSRQVASMHYRTSVQQPAQRLVRMNPNGQPMARGPIPQTTIQQQRTIVRAPGQPPRIVVRQGQPMQQGAPGQQPIRRN